MTYLASPPRSTAPQEVSRWQYFVTEILQGKLPVPKLNAGVLVLPPLAAAPSGIVVGTLAMSDGTGTGFDGASGAGLYRYTGAAWVFVG
jgi:hypothetical protein